MKGFKNLNFLSSISQNTNFTPSEYVSDLHTAIKETTGIRNVRCDQNTKNTPYQLGLTYNASDGVAKIYAPNSNFSQTIYHVAGNEQVFVKYMNGGNWRNWARIEAYPALITLQELSSPTQLTHNGIYRVATCSEEINANVTDESFKFSDYETGDFTVFLLSNNVNEQNGCRFGTLFLASPRFTYGFWVAQIWDYQFKRWNKIGNG